jgi:hypothetical protein
MMRLKLRPQRPTRLVLTVATMALFLLAAMRNLDGVPQPLVQDVRNVSYLALQPDGTLGVKYVALDTYWNRHRRRLTNKLGVPHPLVPDSRDISFLALQPDGTLQVKRVQLDTYWNRRPGRRLSELLYDDPSTDLAASSKDLMEIYKV